MKSPIEYDWLMPLAPWECPDSLKEVLLSLCLQTWEANCLVVSVDGLLPEALREVLVSSSLPLRILEAPIWQGVGAVLSSGISACSSPWILRTDADDISHPKRAELQLAYLDLHPQLAVLGCQMSEVASNKDYSVTRSVPTTHVKIKRMMLWRNPINHPTVAFSRVSVLAAGNYRTCPAFEDWYLWLRMINCGFQFANLSVHLVTAKAGVAHLSRRHGWSYFCRESRFFMRCGIERLLPLPQVLLLMIIRLPWRVFPTTWLAIVMGFLRISSNSK